MAKYMLLSYGPPARTQHPTAGLDVSRLTAELVATGEYVYGVGLADPGFTQVVTVRNGRATVTDGPYGDASGDLASLGVVEVDSHDRALQVAARTAALLGPVEVRPLADDTDADPGQ